MLKHIIILLPLLLVFFEAAAQFDTAVVKKNLLHCADSLTQAFKSKDWEKYTRYSYPAMIGTLGGKKAFIDYVAKNFNAVPDTAWKQYEPGKVLQLIKTDRDIQAIVELHSLIEWQGIRVISTSYLVGESWSEGLYWTFFDSQNDINAAKTIKPDLSNQMIIPAKKEKMEPIGPASSSGPPKKAGNIKTNR